MKRENKKGQEEPKGTMIEPLDSRSKNQTSDDSTPLLTTPHNRSENREHEEGALFDLQHQS